MSVFDNSSPAQGHQALSDIDQIRNNLIALRDNEQSLAASPPSNPVAGQFWWTTDTKTLYKRNQANTAWIYLWSETDPPAKSSDLTSHINANITPATTVHGIKQGSGNGFDADTLDGSHSSAFSAAGHGHAGVYEPVFSKNGAFNKNFGTAAGTVAEGNHGAHLAADAVNQSHIATAAVGQGELKTSSGAVSTTSSGSFTLPGGNYGFYPETKIVNGGNMIANIAQHSTATYGTYIYLESVLGGSRTAYAQQRYITASAPYNLGNGDIPLFVFGIIDNSTGDVIATYTAEAPPWMYNGRPENTFNPQKYKKKPGKKNYFYDRALPLPDKAIDFEAYLAAINNPQYEEIEITPAMKNLDMDIIPHPFMGNDLTGKSVVLLDPVGSMAEKMRDLHDMGESVADLLTGRYLLIDNEAAGANSPAGVKTHKVKWKST